MSKATKSNRIALYRSMIEGVGVHLGSVAQVTLLGVAFTMPELVKLLQKLVDAGSVVESAKTKLHDAVQAERSEVQTDGPFVRAFKRYLLATFRDATVLASFGLAPSKPRAVPTSDQVVAAVVRRRATRVARHTMGKKQKQRIHGSAGTPATSGSTGETAGAATPTPSATTSKP
jgi:hypothetical protein